ncbi:MAG: plastocyanin, partial [Candidatus Paceibacteria bacterium]
GGAGDQPLLYINDGSGNFTEKVGAGWNPPSKNSQMDVQLVDIDNDWDLDFVGYCRGSNAGGNHFLMLNDGTANFTNASALLPDGSATCYEAEVGDLDGDLDTDIFMVSLSGFQEGAVRNNWVESGETSLTFTTQSPLSIAQDDNEIALCDYDNDGDLDIAVGSLGTKERLYRNDGAFNFAGNSGIIQSVGDATLDCTFADVDNDGDYDLITAQGESGSSQWANKVYINSGPQDTLAPKHLAEQTPGLLGNTSGPWVGHIKVQDAVVDDGINYLTAAVHYVVAANASDPVVIINAGAFSPSNLNVTAGTLVVFQNNSGGNQSVTSTTAPYTYDSGLLVNGQLYGHVFVRAGVYQFDSGPGGFSGSVTVTGATQLAQATHSKGGIYRGSMSGDASATDAALYYEFEVLDWAGNILVTDGVKVPKTAGSAGMAYCFGDGSGAACPCGANGGTGEGCANTSGSGATLSGSGSTSFSSDSLQLHIVGVPGSKPGLILRGDNQIANPAGDGILCTAGGSQRSHVQITSSGATTYTDFNGAGFGSVANMGSPTNFQFWYRDPTNTCSGAGFNFSNGLSVDYLP